MDGIRIAKKPYSDSRDQHRTRQKVHSPILLNTISAWYSNLLLFRRISKLSRLVEPALPPPPPLPVSLFTSANTSFHHTSRESTSISVSVNSIAYPPSWALSILNRGNVPIIFALEKTAICDRDFSLYFSDPDDKYSQTTCCYLTYGYWLPRLLFLSLHLRARHNPPTTSTWEAPYHR